MIDRDSWGGVIEFLAKLEREMNVKVPVWELTEDPR